MNKEKKFVKRAVFIIIIILLIDQVSKIYIKTHFVLSEEIKVMGLDWFRIHFLENNGMAWGKEFGGRSGKLFLTLFRLVAIAGIGYWLYDAIKNNAHRILHCAFHSFLQVLWEILLILFFTGFSLVIVIVK